MESEPLPDDDPSQPPGTPCSEADFARLRDDLTRAIGQVCPSWLHCQAEDLVQLAVIKVIDVCRRSEGIVEFSPLYLRKTAYSAVVDEIRRSRRRREVALGEDPVATDFAGGEPSPERQARGREAVDAVRECLGRMIRTRRLAVTLHLQGHRVREIARLLGWGEKRAENLVYRGLDDLRECLDGKGVE